MEKFLSKAELIDASKVPRQTLERWLRSGKLKPVGYDDKGKAQFSESQIAECRGMHRTQNTKKRKADSMENLFNGDATNDTAKIESEDTQSDKAEDSDKVEEKSCGNDETSSSPKGKEVDSTAEDSAPDDSTATANEDTEPVVSNDTANEYTEPVVSNDTNATTAPADNNDDTKAEDSLSVVPADNATTTDTGAQMNDVIVESPPFDSEANITLEDRANRIRELQADVQRGIIEIGEHLIAAKKQVGHGNWGDWLKSEFEWTQQTANRFMRVAERFGQGKLNNVVKFKPSTLQAMLALPVGEEKDFIDAQAEGGNPVESQSARQLQKSIEDWKKSKSESKKLPGEDEELPGITINMKNLKLINTNDDQEPDITTADKSANDTATDSTNDKSNDDTPANDTNADKSAEDKAADNVGDKKPAITNCHNGTVEYYTPQKFVDAARKVLGEIDLDPASCETANQTVKAKEFYSKENDGLQHDWRGRIFMNPPFAKGMIECFVDKFIAEYDAGNISAAVVLVDNITETKYFRRLVDRADALCFTTSRINFDRPENETVGGGHTRGQVFVYYGEAREKFFAEFAEIGWLAVPYSFPQGRKTEEA